MTKSNYYKVTLRVQNEIGVLARIAVRLRKFQVNIRSLDAALIDKEEKFSDLHIILETKKENIKLIMNKLKCLIPVIDVQYQKTKLP